MGGARSDEVAVEQSPGRVSQSVCMIAVVQALSGSTTAEVITSYIQKKIVIKGLS